MTQEEKIRLSARKAGVVAGGMASLGFGAGLWYAYKHDQKFWGYVGFALLGSIVFGAAGRIIGGLMVKTE
jgi:hypothetical protein